MWQRNTTKRVGFTLIELLIVIAIIAVLITILAPALHTAREHARSAVCAGHLHQWGHIWTLYLDEQKGLFPAESRIKELDVGWYRGAWITALSQEWQKKPQLLMCPKAKIKHPDGKNYGGPEYAYVMGEGYRDYYCSYGSNCWIFSDPLNVQNRNPAYYWKKRDNIKYPTEVPLFLDSMWRGGGPHYGRTQAYQAPQENGQWDGASREMMHFAIDRHRGFVNSLFADTSARKVGLKKLWTLRWHTDFDVGYIRTLEDSGGWVWPDWMQSLPQ